MATVDLTNLAEKVKRWRVIYPIYINAGAKRKDGRRLPKEQCVEAPIWQELAAVCKSLNMPCKAEPEKAYPRDFMQRGRVRVCMSNDDGSPIDPDIVSRKALMKYMCMKIPMLQIRKERLAMQKAAQEKSAKQSGGGATQTATGGGKKKKKKKKKRK